MQKGDVHLVAEVEKEIELKSMEFTRIDQLLLACKAALYRPKLVAEPALKEEPGGELMAEEVRVQLSVAAAARTSSPVCRGSPADRA